VNRIEAARAKSKFVQEPHLTITVDGVPLDELLETAVPDANVAGLVSSLLGWFDKQEDNALPWERILPNVGCTGYAPILICPDDLDYNCTVVMVEVVAEPEVVRWDRIGYASGPGTVGSCIRWLPGVGPYRFSRTDYVRCLSEFRRVDAAAVR
jgi:hypothetical protein